MLSQIQIRNYAIIDELVLDCGNGLTVITGETGAGKSIMIGAIGLVLGERAHSSMVRDGEKKAEISLIFDDISESFKSWLNDQDLESDDECVLRRIVTREGKSRCYINGSPTTLANMRAAAEFLVEITGQNTHQSLLKPTAQRYIVDSQADILADLNDLSQYWKEWSDYKDTLAALLSNSQERQLQIDLIQFQLEELKELAPVAGEINELHDKQKVLANAEHLLRTSQSLEQDLYDEDQSLYQQLSLQRNAIAELSSLDSQLEPSLQLIDEALIQIQEASNLIRQNREGISLDPEQLSQVDQRLQSSHDLARKHKVDPDTLPDKMIALEHELMQLTGPLKNPEEVEAALEKAQARYDKLAKKVSSARKKAAASMAKAVTKELQRLGMEGSDFSIELNALDAEDRKSHGRETIAFNISTNPGQPAAAMQKIVSGGELSRVSLAIQLIAASRMRFPTLIFDEVDAGIGGGTAHTVGKLLSELGENCQVFCITHLPQVASYASNHLYISKAVNKNQTATQLTQLNEEQRVEEIARMLGGDSDSSESLGHARAMLAKA